MEYLPNWIRRNMGRAKSAFSRAITSKQTPGRRESGMVRRAAPSLADGPKPPGVVGHAVRRERFNQQWSSEARAARNHRLRASKSAPQPLRGLEARKAQLKTAYQKSAHRGLAR